MNCNQIFNHFKLKLIKEFIILNETNAIFFEYKKNAIKRLIDKYKNEDFL